MIFFWKSDEFRMRELGIVEKRTAHQRGREGYILFVCVFFLLLLRGRETLSRRKEGPPPALLRKKNFQKRFPVPIVSLPAIQGKSKVQTTFPPRLTSISHSFLEDGGGEKSFTRPFISRERGQTSWNSFYMYIRGRRRSNTIRKIPSPDLEKGRE